MSFISSLASTFGRTAQKARDFLFRDVTLSVPDALLVPPELRGVLDHCDLEHKRQREVLKARAFHEGDHGVRLTDRLREFLGEDFDDAPCLNFTYTANMAICERLKVESLEATGPDATRQTTWANEVWDNSRMDTKQSDVWEEVGVDGEHFILVEWNAEADNGVGEVEFIPHPRYTDPTIQCECVWGDGFGIRMIYPSGDTSRRPLYALKRSTEIGEDGRRQKRLTIYRPGEIARYYCDEAGGWMPLREVDPLTGDFRQWPQRWVNPITGAPLGIPVVHLKTPRLRSEARGARKLQRALNKLYLDFLIANDENAFRIWIYAGWDPGAITTAPGSWIGSPHSKKEDGFEARAVEGSDTTPMLNGIEKTIGFAAMLTDTPLSRFTMTGQVARAETLQQQDAPLQTKVENRQGGYGQGIGDAFKIGRRIQNAFGPSTDGALSEDTKITPVWKPFHPPIAPIVAPATTPALPTPNPLPAPAKSPVASPAGNPKSAT